MQEEEILDSDVLEQEYELEDQYIISVDKFVILCILTLGLYEIWWSYKAWRFFKLKEKSDIMPAARVIFGIIFIIPLLNKIQDMAASKGYNKRYPTVLLFIGFILFNMLSKLPDPYWLVSLIAFVFMIPPFKAFNYARQQSTEFRVIEQTSFNGKQLGLIIVGLIFWGLMILGLTMEV